MAIEFEVKLSDGVTKVAISAAQQVDVLAKQMKSLQNAIIKTNALGDSDAMSKLKEKYSLLNAEFMKLGGPSLQATAAQEKEQAKLAKEMAKVAAAQEKSAAAQAAKQAQLQKEISDQSKLSNVFKSSATELNAYVAIAKQVVQAFVAIGQAVVGVIVAVADMAQQRAQLEATFNAIGGGQGKQAAAMFDRLSRVIPLSTATMAEFGQKIAVAGIRDMAKMEQAIKAAAASSAILGDTSGKAGDKIVGLVVDIQKAIKLRQGIGDISSALEGTGINADEVAKSMGITERQLRMMAASGLQLNKIGNAIQDALIKKGVEPMRTMMASFDVMGKRVKDIIAGFFSGVAGTAGFKAFSEQMLRLLDLFSAGTSQGKLAKQGMTSAFDVIFKLASVALREMRYGILRTEIELLKLYISFKPTIRTMREWGEKVDAAKTMSTGFVTIIQLLGKGIWNLTSGLRTTVTATLAIGTAFTLMIGKLSQIYDSIAEVVSPWVDLFLDLGKDMVNGLVKGLKNGAIAIKDAVVGLGKGAVDAFKGALDIKSPSRVFAQLGVQTTAGYAVGVQQSAPMAMAATTDMAGKAAEGGKVGVTVAPRATPSRGGIVVNVGGITIENGSGSPVELLEEAVVSLFERVALTQGVA
ncbi:MAG: hypothetical protein RIS45_1101 [Planctomycetota bacterium]|jgi:hypothetical protein